MNFVRDNLAICGFADIGSRESFEAFGFDAQLQCTEPFDMWLHECVEVKALAFSDGEPISREIMRPAQEWLTKQWSSGKKILISCAMGRSRSVTMASTFLCKNEGCDFVTTTLEVVDTVPNAYPHPYLLVSAAVYCGEMLSVENLTTIYSAVKNQPSYPWQDDLIEQAVKYKYD